MSNDSMLDMFIYENAQLTEQLEEVLMQGEKAGAFNNEHINEIFRIMHTIKGSAAMMDFNNTASLGHAVEDMFFYIREHQDRQYDWTTIADICLESADFFKQEAAKISMGEPLTEKPDDLVARIKEYMVILTGGAPAAPPAASEAPPPAAVSALPAEASGSLNKYHLHLFFDEGCKMENIRSFQFSNNLQELSTSLVSKPDELLEDCSDEIAANGVQFFIETPLPIATFQKLIAETMFLRDSTVKPVDANPFAAPAESVAAESAIVPEPTAAAAPVSAPAVTQAAAPAPVADGEARPAEAKQTFISVSVDKLDKLMDLVGELLTSVSMVVRNSDLVGLKLENFEKAASLLQKNTSEMQDLIMSVRMIPISSTFHKMHRIVRDVSKKLSKDVEFVILGEETEVDKNIIDSLSDPLMHIVRNSVDHGLEDTREERVAAGKKPMGRVTLEARNSGSDVIITASDDGKGLDRKKILAKAARTGMLTKHEEEYTDREVYQLILLPGFSTNENVTELSGRGVGMDVVKKNIEKVGGTIALESTPGEGMSVVIRIPLTLAIMASIEVVVGKNTYLVPTLNIREAFKPKNEDIIIDPDGREMVLFRGECYTIIRLHQLFSVETEIVDFEKGILIMVEDEGQMVGLFADRLVSEQSVVVKPIPPFISKHIGQIHGISGCTILGNGAISLIIDVKSLTQQD